MITYNPDCGTWVRKPEAAPVLQYNPLNNEIRVLQELLDQQAREIDLLRKVQHKGVIIETVKALKCPCCDAPIQFDSRPYILETKNIRRRCEYCGNLLEFLTKE